MIRPVFQASPSPGSNKETSVATKSCLKNNNVATKTQNLHVLDNNLGHSPVKMAETMRKNWPKNLIRLVKQQRKLNATSNQVIEAMSILRHNLILSSTKGLAKENETSPESEANPKTFFKLGTLYSIADSAGVSAGAQTRATHVSAETFSTQVTGQPFPVYKLHSFVVPQAFSSSFKL